MLTVALTASALAAFNGPAMMPSTRTVDVVMAAKKAPAKKAPAKKAPAKKAAAPRNFFGTAGFGGSIDVATGATYQDAQLEFSAQRTFDEIGVLPPLGRWDPLKIREQGPERYRRFVEMEIKHGRLAMAAVAGILTTYSGIRFPGYLSKSLDLKFEDIPGTMLGSWATVPQTGWIQIVLWIAICEIDWLKQDPNKDAGDVVKEGSLWARYPDGYTVYLGDGSEKAVGEDELFLGKTWKLNAERNNGRAAMMGITGMYIHELLTGNPVFPIGEA